MKPFKISTAEMGDVMNRNVEIDAAIRKCNPTSPEYKSLLEEKERLDIRIDLHVQAQEVKGTLEERGLRNG